MFESELVLVDATYHTAYTLSVKQVPPSRKDSEENTIDSAVNHIKMLKQERITIALPQYIASDGFYAKRRFINGALEAGFHVISKLRKDANLRYLYEPPRRQRKKRGRPRRYGSKINLDSLDLSKFFCYAIDEHIRLSGGIVYRVFLKRKIHLVSVTYADTAGKQSYALLFSTDVTLDVRTLYRYYTARFQIEFVFRDAKQFTGLTHCQA
ncbi:MAG: Mobile element protein [Candidatus Jettenia ecosi]|uniref:Mobile element protein n=1 Tax=Candidatus Jettenia ecosi TaxID=2494326 RepID=A0A533Q6I0_9BACT|nr:MAG: Mobile element protein [Candidatus Jettenia ecosi]